MTDFLQLEGKNILVMGLANRKSVAYHIGKLLVELGASVVYSVRTEARRDQVARLVAPAPVWVCDVTSDEQIEALSERVGAEAAPLHGLVHSIAFADYDAQVQSFHHTPRRVFLHAMDVSCYSLIAVARALEKWMAEEASVVALSISTTRMAAENYGVMGPVKAALDSSLTFLAKSFSGRRVRFNAVGPGLLKTKASAGIPGYVDSYLFAEAAIPRKRAVTTEEAAATAVFLLSPRASGINAQTVVVDAGMSINYFDEEIVARVVRS